MVLSRRETIQMLGVSAAASVLQSACATGARTSSEDTTSAGNCGATGFANTRAMVGLWVHTRKFAPGISIVMAQGTGQGSSVCIGRLGTWADAPLATADSLWRQYSMTKTVTAITAMTLIDSGAMGMDDPLSKYIPEFAQMRVLEERSHCHTGLRLKRTRPAKGPITLRNLMTHTAGMGYSMVKGPLEHLYFDHGINPWQIDRIEEDLIRPFRPKSLQDFARKVATLPLFADPGTVWAYSIGLDVLAAVVEVVAGKPYEDYVQEKLFVPLGMKSSYWTVPHSERGRMSTNFLPAAGCASELTPLDPRESSVWYLQPSFPYGGAGLVMSALDYDQLLAMLMNQGTLNGVQVLSPKAVDTALSNLLPNNGKDVDLSQLYAMVGQNVVFGAGGYVTTKADEDNGRAEGTYGWGGFAGTCFWIDRKKGVRASGMVNVLPHIDQLPVPREISIVGPLIVAAYQDLAPAG